MSDKEIKKLAGKRLTEFGGSCVLLEIFLFSFIDLVVLCEATMFLFLRRMGFDWLYKANNIFDPHPATLFWFSKTALEIVLLTPVINLVRRLFIDVARGRSPYDTRQYISAHSLKYYSRVFYSSFIYNMIRFFVAVPGLLAAYGIYYWSYVLEINEFSSLGLFCLTGCVSAAGAWIGITVHYYISLSLAPYIMALNPRSNIFDACDLSVRLMYGRHGRYIRFVADFLKYLPLALLIYPMFVIYPYFKISYSLFMDELLGNFSHDKMPGMIKRWRKYS